MSPLLNVSLYLKAVSFNMQAMVNAWENGIGPICRGAAGAVIVRINPPWAVG